MSNSYTPITGNPRRKTKQSSSDGNAGGSSAQRNAPGNRKRRVTVTPRDPERVEALADEFGLPQSKIYDLR